MVNSTSQKENWRATFAELKRDKSLRESKGILGKYDHISMTFRKKKQKKNANLFTADRPAQSSCNWRNASCEKAIFLCDYVSIEAI